MTTPAYHAQPTLTATRLIFVYAMGYTLFDLIPVAFSDADAFKGLTWGDIFDAPLVVLPVALLFRMALDANLWRTTGLRAAVLLGLLIFAQGHAIHLAANAISHHLQTADPAWEPTYLLDEHVGHYEQHVALLGLAALFIWFGHPSRLPRGQEVALFGLTIAGYGLLQAAGAIEGQAVPLVLPVSVALTLIGASVAARRSSEYAMFFAASYAICFLALIAYGAINHGWPEIL